MDGSGRDDAQSRLFDMAVWPLQAFLRLEAASAILLFACAVAAFAWANVDPENYRRTFETRLSLAAGDAAVSFTVRELIDDGLMTVFFFVVGMEIKRELVLGELDSVAKATLPAVAALGAMFLPSAIYLAFNAGGPGRAGWSVPMATDIAFCVGVLRLLADRVPRPLVVFVTALAIFDDIAGILVIALFYGSGMNASWLGIAAALVVLLAWMNNRHVVSGLAYALVGGALWHALHHGGVHATMAGVVLGLAIPARPRTSGRAVLQALAGQVAELDGAEGGAEPEGARIHLIEKRLEALQSPLSHFTHVLHPFVAFLVMPLFALANSGVTVRDMDARDLVAPVALGTAAGLFVGKQLGVFVFTMLAVRLRLAPMPGGARKAQLFGVGIVAGIGFTVALFIAGLAFHDAPRFLDQAKLGILIGSGASGVVGFVFLRLLPQRGSAAARAVTS
jgi:NhaA family Na+:H+ antiporter